MLGASAHAVAQTVPPVDRTPRAEESVPEADGLVPPGVARRRALSLDSGCEPRVEGMVAEAAESADQGVELAEEVVEGGGSGSGKHAGAVPPPAGADGALAAADAEVMPPHWMDVVVTRAMWIRLGLDAAPFCVQAEAPMHLVHFCFSQLTLNAVFVVDKGRFIGMINKVDMIHQKF